MGVLSKITSEYFGDIVRDDEGIMVNFFGKEYIMKFKDFPILNELQDLGDGKLFLKKDFDFFGEPVYVVLHIDNSWGSKGPRYRVLYFREGDIEADGNIIKKGYFFNVLCNANYNVFDDDFLIIRILQETLDGMDESIMDFNDDFWIGDNEKDKTSHSDYISVENKKQYLIFRTRESAEKYAKDIHQEKFDDDYEYTIPADDAESYIDNYGLSWVQIDELKEKLRERLHKMYDDMKEEEGEHGNTLYDKLIDDGEINDTDEYFFVDSSKPKFYPGEYREQLVGEVMQYENITEEEAEKIVDGYDDKEYIDELISYSIVSETEDFFELDYTTPTHRTNEVIEGIVENEIPNDDEDVVKKYMDKFGELPYEAYDLYKLAEFDFNDENIAEYISEFDGVEYECNIDGNEYLVYIIE